MLQERDRSKNSYFVHHVKIKMVMSQYRYKILAYLNTDILAVCVCVGGGYHNTGLEKVIQIKLCRCGHNSANFLWDFNERWAIFLQNQCPSEN